MQALLEELSRRKKQALAVALDIIILPFALWTAFALRLGEWQPNVLPFWPAFVAVICVAVPVFGRLGLYRQVIRYLGSHAMRAIVVGTLCAALAVAVMAGYQYLVRGNVGEVFPRSVPVIFWMLAFLYVAGSRFGMRAYMQRFSRMQPKEPVLIYGAGSKGVELARMLKQQDAYSVVAFVDANTALQGRTIDGVHVYAPTELARLLSSYKVKQVLVAVKRDTQSRPQLLAKLKNYAVHVRLIPDISEMMSGLTTVTDLRDVSVEDLLGRNQVEPMQELLEGSAAGRTVMVTGAGGSIGSELCRQIIALRPSTLVLLDQSEFALYQINRELELLADHFGVPLVPVLGTVLDSHLLKRTMTRYRVDTIYHTAAYKHVNLVENNIIQGLKNNTFGTLHCAQVAMQCKVAKFILISTDKAVRTTSVMGASKRLAEMVLQALETQSEHTRFAVVRFGNVMGSSGSVVPLFSEQIASGGPVTVTHPEVTRYFMSIQEAAQLVLQAASMSRGGDVFLLDMGQPVRILDLARQMVALKGLTVKDEEHPDGDIEIQFTGLKPGEKLHEDLLVSGDPTGTRHRRIMRASETFVPWVELSDALRTLEAACNTFDYDAIQHFIQGLVEGADLERQLHDLLQPEKVVTLKRPEH